jgi:thiosulfate dehydrogenase
MQEKSARNALIVLTVGVILVLALAVAGWRESGWPGLDRTSANAAAALAADQSAVPQQITACDHRKTVVVEGYRDDEPLPPAKARQVASLLTDLMQYCSEEVQAKIATDERIFLSVNGSAFVQWVPGQALPLVPVHGKPHTAREQQIWKAELTRLVDEGNQLFHNSKLGTNGISCDMCHPNASNTHPETYPKFQTQLKKVALLRDMINWCIENPLEGKKLAEDDAQMKALEAYILWQRTGKALEPGKH